MSHRLKSLDVMRGIALMLIFVRHNEAHSAHFAWVNWILDFLSGGGWIALDFFFVLSGFLIANLLFSEYKHYGRIDFWHFFLRRGFKIYPSYYFMIGVTLALLVFLKIPFNAKAIPHILLFFQNYFFGTDLSFTNIVGRMWAHTWSLAVEEHFYFFLPALLIGISTSARCKKNAFRVIPLVFLLTAIVCLGLRIVKNLKTPFLYYEFTSPTHLRADTPFFGVLIAYYYNYQYAAFKKVILFLKPLTVAAVGGLFLLPAFIHKVETSPIICTVGLTFFYVGCGLVLAGVLMMRYKDNWVFNQFSVLGRHSYCIYLWHLPFKTLSDYVNGIYHSGILYFCLYTACPLIVGIMLSRFMEVPLLRLRDKMIPTRSAHLVVGVNKH